MPDELVQPLFGNRSGALVVNIGSVRRTRRLPVDEIKSFGKQHLASYKVPRSVAFLEELPRTGSGKILKRQLRAPYWAGRTAQVS